MFHFEDFRETRWIKFGNRSVQILLSLTLAFGLNYLAATHFTRADLTQTREYSLAPETLAHISELVRAPDAEPITVYVTLPRDSDQPGTRETVAEVDRLMREFEFAGRVDGEKRIRVEPVDIFQQRAKAQELREKYGVKDISTAMVVTRGERYRQIPVKDLYEWKDGAVVSFLGERVVASALLDVGNAKAEKVYFVLGHGEMKPLDIDPNDGLSEAVGALSQRNLTPEPTTLVDGKVPDDAALLIIAGPQTPFLPREVEALRRYLEDRRGRVLVYVDPRQRHGLDQLFYEWGLLADDRMIIDLGMGATTGDGDLVVATFADHPVTRSLAEYDKPVLLGPTRPVRKDDGAPLDERLIVRELLLTSPQSWAETDFRNTDDKESGIFTPARDVQGPLSVGALAERGAGSQIGISLQGGKLVVFGSTGLIANRRFHALGNEWLFLNAVNWMLNKDSRLNVPPRPMRTFQLPMTRDDAVRCAVYFAVPPALVALFGIFVFWLRRR